MDPITRIIEQAKQKSKTIVLPEGNDARTWAAARKLVDEGIAVPVILGTPEEIEAGAKESGVSAEGIAVLNPQTSEKRQAYAEEFAKMRAKKGMTVEQALETMKDVLYYGAMMVRMGDADGGVTGAAHATGDVMRAAFQTIGMLPGMKTVSSIFMMIMPDGKIYSFGDCAIVPNPDPEQLASITIASAGTHKALTGEDPTVAMLSFSTKGSAKNELADKVIEAYELVKQQAPELKVDGELQFDAAIVEAIGKKKAPGSDVAGHANVLVFPDLNAGNIGYKIAQRLAGAEAIGPVVQGLSKPYYDLSRGCSADDIVKLSAVSSVVAQSMDN